MIRAQMTRKRDGETLQPFDVTKLENAIGRAWKDTTGSIDEKALAKVLATVTSALTEDTVDVETVQDAVETALMRHKQFAVAKAYIVYRHSRAEARLARVAMTPDPFAISNYIHAGKYARYLPELKRREVFAETVSRVEAMHVGQFPAMTAEITEAFDLVREKKLLPSMRSFQFSGPAILDNNCRQYNCSFSHIDRFEAFSEALFLLLSGCGVGYSIQFDHVEKLPSIPYIDAAKIRHHVVGDRSQNRFGQSGATMRRHADDICPETFRCLGNRCCRFAVFYYLQLSFDSSQFSFGGNQTMELPFDWIMLFGLSCSGGFCRRRRNVKKTHIASTMEERISIRNSAIAKVRKICRDEHAFQFGDMSCVFLVCCVRGHNRNTFGGVVKNRARNRTEPEPAETLALVGSNHNEIRRGLTCDLNQQSIRPTPRRDGSNVHVFFPENRDNPLLEIALQKSLNLWRII